MFSSLMQSDSPATCQLEEAATSLNDAIAHYAELCRSLGDNALHQGASLGDLSMRIGLAQEEFHVTLEQQITCAQLTLAKTRNRITSPIYRLPEEILSEILAHVIYTPPFPLDRCHYRIEDTLVNIYRSLYNLLGVCSKWRTLALAKGSFWSVVPILKEKYSSSGLFMKTHPCSTRLSLERARGGDLHLAVALPDFGPDDTFDLTDFAPRFRTINISCKALPVIHHTLDYFRNQGSSNRLRELSIFFETKGVNHIPQENDYVFRSSDPKQRLFEQLVNSLLVLRIRGAMFHLNAALSSSQLVELHLQAVTLGHDSKLAELLIVLSTVAGLRHLRLISVKTFPDNGLTPIQPVTTSTSVSLPSLQTLLLGDLYANALQLLLSFISSRTHRSTLHLTEKCYQVQGPDDPRPVTVGIQALTGLPGCSCVSTLMLNGIAMDRILAEDLRTIITSVPNIETLQMLGWSYSQEHCEALSQSQDTDPQTFPRLKNLHVYSSNIKNTIAFASMVASHSASLEWMILGAGIEKNTYGEMEWEDLYAEDEIVVWLRRNVRNFEHIHWGFEPPEFDQNPEWQLW